MNRLLDFRLRSNGIQTLVSISTHSWIVFLNAIVLVEHEDEISSLVKHEWGFAERSFFLSELLIAVITYA